MEQIHEKLLATFAVKVYTSCKNPLWPTKEILAASVNKNKKVYVVNLLVFKLAVTCLQWYGDVDRI